MTSNIKSKLITTVVTCLSVTALWSCSGGSTTDTSTDSPAANPGVSSAISSGALKIKAGLPGGTSRGFLNQKSAPSNSISILATDLDSTQFTTADVTGISSSFDSPKTYLQYLIDETPEDTPSNGMGVFQRYRQKVMQSMCAFIVLLPDTNSDSMPDVGTASVTIPATISTDMATRCPEATIGMFSNVAGETVSAVITDVSAESGTNYDIKGVFTGASGAIDGMSLGQFYYRSAGGVIRFMFLEPGASGSVSLYEYSNSLVRFEYIALSSQKQHFRFLLNETTGDTAFYGYEKNASSANQIYATGVSNTGNTTQAAFALTAETTGTDYSDAHACIEPSDALTHLGTWSAACTAITGVGFSTVPSIVTGLASVSLTNTDMNQEDTIQFTSSTDLVSAGFPQ